MQVVDDDPERPWYEPGAYRVTEGVIRVPLPIPEDGLRAVNAYVLAGAEDVTVIDPGAGVEVALEALRRGLGALDVGLADVDRSLATHVHYDHYTQAVALRRRHGTPVWLGRHEGPSLERLASSDRSLAEQVPQLVRYGELALAQVAAGRRADSDVEELLSEGPDRWIDDDTQLDVAGTDLRALHTPGHTRGHVVLRDERRGLLFAGDHVLPTITPSLGFEAAPTDLPLAAYLDSLHRVRRLPDTRLLPAHGRVTASVHERIDELLEHHRTRLAAALAAVGRGATTGLEVAEQLRWTRRERQLDELDTFNRMLAVLETGFHLDLLVERGALRVELIDGVARYVLG